MGGSGRGSIRGEAPKPLWPFIPVHSLRTIARGILAFSRNEVIVILFYGRRDLAQPDESKAYFMIPDPLNFAISSFL